MIFWNKMPNLGFRFLFSFTEKRPDRDFGCKSRFTSTTGKSSSSSSPSRTSEPGLVTPTTKVIAVVVVVVVVTLNKLDPEIAGTATLPLVSWVLLSLLVGQNLTDKCLQASCE